MIIAAEDQFMAVVICLTMWGVYEFMWWRREVRAMSEGFIAVPPRTGLRVIVRCDRMWVVWTGVDDMQAPYSQWRGTCLQLHDNGTAYSVCIQPDGSEDVLRIK